MNVRRSFGALVGASALVVSLVACGGGSATPDLAEMRDEFVGTWELVSMESENANLNEDDVATMADSGMLVTLDLDEDGNLIFNELGSQQEGSWSVKDESTLSLEIGGATVSVPFEDDQLTVESGGSTMVFEKASDEPDMDRQPEDNAGGAGEIVDELEDIDTEEIVDNMDDVVDDGGGSGDVSADDFAYVFSDDMIFMQEMLYAGATQTVPLDITVADDSVALIQVTGLAEDFEGDTGFLVHVENRTDTDFVVTNVTTTLDGEDVYYDATLLCTVAAGGSADGFFYFDSEVAVVTESSSVEAILVPLDIDENPLGMYSMSY